MDNKLLILLILAGCQPGGVFENSSGGGAKSFLGKTSGPQNDSVEGKVKKSEFKADSPTSALASGPQKALEKIETALEKISITTTNTNNITIDIAQPKSCSTKVTEQILFPSVATFTNELVDYLAKLQNSCGASMTESNRILKQIQAVVGKFPSFLGILAKKAGQNSKEPLKEFSVTLGDEDLIKALLNELGIQLEAADLKELAFMLSDVKLSLVPTCQGGEIKVTGNISIKRVERTQVAVAVVATPTPTTMPTATATPQTVSKILANAPASSDLTQDSATLSTADSSPDASTSSDPAAIDQTTSLIDPASAQKMDPALSIRDNSTALQTGSITTDSLASLDAQPVQETYEYAETVVIEKIPVNLSIQLGTETFVNFSSISGLGSVAFSAKSSASLLTYQLSKTDSQRSTFDGTGSYSSGNGQYLIDWTHKSGSELGKGSLKFKKTDKDLTSTDLLSCSISPEASTTRIQLQR